MSRHVAPHRWADAFAGKVSDAERAAMDRHAEQCPRCARARDRIERASQSFPALRAQSAPELAWDSVRARVHWSVSKERRTNTRAAQSGRRPRIALVVGGALAASAVGIAIAVAAFRGGEPTATPAPLVSAEPAPAVAPAPLAGVVSRLTGQVLIDGVRGDDAFERTLAAGTVIATGRGRIDVQFGERSAFSLGPSSTLELRRFDAEQIELVVEGTIDVEVATRAPGQRFLVVAGERTVEVRGTQFRVRHDADATRVACRHGRVAVRDRGGEREVASARELVVAAAESIDAARVRALGVDELEQLASAIPVMVPLWTEPETLVKTSAALEIATVGTRAVRIDGVEVGDAPLRVRVMPGRHTVETADRAGRFRRAGWVDVEPAKPARLAVQAEATEVPTGGTATRRRQLHAALDHTRLAHCTRAIRKAGLSAYVAFEISIDETGAVQFLNVVDSDLPSSTRNCVREVLVDIQFRPGPAATFRDKLEL